MLLTFGPLLSNVLGLNEMIRSVTKFGKILPLWQKIEGSFSIWHNCEPILAIFWALVKFSLFQIAKY